MSGYKGCPLCGPETCDEHAQLLSKMIFLGGRRFLGMHHRFRRSLAAFNNHLELDMAPERPSGREVLQWGTERSEFLAAGGQESSIEDPVKRHDVKRRSLLFDLPYWKVCIITDGQ